MPKDKSNQQVVNIIQELGKGIRKHGVAHIIRVLRSMEVSDNIYPTIDFIIKECAEKFNVAIDEIYKSEKRGDVVAGRKVAIMLIRNHLFLSDKECSAIFGKDRQVVQNTEREFRNLDVVKFKYDKQLMDAYEEIGAKVTDFMTKNKKTKNK